MPDDITVTCPECGRSFTGKPGGQGNVYRSLSMHVKRTHPDSTFDLERPEKPDAKPPSTDGLRVDLNVGVNKGKPVDPALEHVRERAEGLVSAAAVILYLLGAEADAADLEKRKEPWAMTVRDLSVHEEWLRKIAEGGEGSERIKAWLAFGVASFVLLAPILDRHGAIPPQIARLLAMVEGQMPAPAPPPPEPMPVPDGAPADSPADLAPVA